MTFIDALQVDVIKDDFTPISGDIPKTIVNQMYSPRNNRYTVEMRRSTVAMYIWMFGYTTRGRRIVSQLPFERFGDNTFGFGRLAMFWRTLRYASIFVNNPNGNFAVAFRTTNASLSTIRELAKGDYYGAGDSDNPGVYVNDEHWVQTNFISRKETRQGLESVQSFIGRLFQQFTTLYSSWNNSGNDGAVTVRTTLNAALLYYPTIGGGSFVEDSKKREYLQKNRSVYFPTESYRNECFWDCLAHILITNKMVECTDVKLLGRTLFTTYSSWMSQRNGGEIIASKMVTLDSLKTVEKCFGIEVIVLDIEGEVLYGTPLNLYSRKFNEEEKTMILCLVDDHYALIKHYLGFLPLLVCYRCQQRFTRREKLKKHLENSVCLTCPCLKVKLTGKKRKQKRGEEVVKTCFNSEEEWRRHQENLLTECPLMSEEACERRKNDESNRIDRYNTRFVKCSEKEVEYELDREAVFFDLESIVPNNDGNMKRKSFLPQIPYAAGWVTLSGWSQGEEPIVSYGLDCLQTFIDYLDNMLEKVRVQVSVLLKEKFERELEEENEDRWNLMKRSWRRYNGKRKEGACMICWKPNVMNYDEHRECLLKYCIQSHTRKEMNNRCSTVCPRIPVYAHNGGRYDWLFLHRWFMERGRLSELRPLRCDGRYISIVYKEMFIFRDSINFLQGSLSSLAKNFQVNTMKGLFPYDLMQDPCLMYSTICGEEEIRTILPKELFKVGDSYGGAGDISFRRPMNEEEYIQFFEEERGWKYDIQAETIKYLIDDVKALTEVVVKFSSGFEALDYRMDLYDFDTIGQMAHYYFLRFYCDKDQYPVLSHAETNYLRKGLYGGRTEVFVRHLDGGAVPESDKKNIYYYDVNSLYPYVMESQLLPGGDPVWYLPPDCDLYKRLKCDLEYQPMVEEMSEYMKEDLKESLNCQCADDVYGFLEVSILPPQSLKYPVLPERRTVNGTQKNFFCLRNKTGVYYSEELKLAIRKGYFVMEVISYSKWSRVAHYQKFVKDLKVLKLRAEGREVDGTFNPSIEKNRSLRQASKLMQNSSFGKTIQRCMNDRTEITDDPKQVWKMVKESDEFSLLPLFTTEHGDVVEVSVKYGEGVNKKSCASIGAAIMAEARIVLYKYFEMVEEVGGEILYCDTDSIVYCGHRPLPPRVLDDVKYGCMKLEIPEENITSNGFVALSPKCYAFRLKDGTPYVKCKGVGVGDNVISSASFQKQMEEMEMNKDVNLLLSLEEEEREGESITGITGVNFEVLQSMVKGEVQQVYSEQMMFLKTRARNVVKVTGRKVLSDTFDKRKVALNGGSFPWTNCNISNYLLDGETTMCSNFLAYSTVEEIGQWIKECGGYEGEAFSKMRPLFQAWCSSEIGKDKCREVDFILNSGTPPKSHSVASGCELV